MAEFIKSASIIEADLRAEVKQLRAAVQDAWAGHEVAIIAIGSFLAGIAAALIL
jgi:precorrin-3B methylase